MVRHDVRRRLDTVVERSGNGEWIVTGEFGGSRQAERGSLSDADAVIKAVAETQRNFGMQDARSEALA